MNTPTTAAALMTTPTEAFTKIERQQLTDGSIVYNVIVDVDGKKVRLACHSADHASRLESEISTCSWVELAA